LEQILEGGNRRAFGAVLQACLQNHWSVLVGGDGEQ
jgi:hypothetical protein